MKTSRNPEKTRAHILAVAFREIYQKGFQGASINDIVAKTDVTKGAFFHYFATKQDLGYAIVDEILSRMIMERWITPLVAYKNPVQGILNRFKKIIESTPDETVCFGCPLNNLIQEMSPVDPVFKEKLKAVTALWIDENETYLKKAQTLGYLKPEVDTRQLAEFVVMVEEASFGLGKSLSNKKIHWNAYHSLRRYMMSLTPDSTNLTTGWD